VYRTNNHRHRKPDFLVILVAVVVLALAASLTVQVHALSSTDTPGAESPLSQSRS